jgi:hypothetical protein
MVGKKDQAMPQQFDLTIGDSMEDIRADTERELTEYTRRRRQKMATVREMVEQNLGPSHKESANPTYVDTLTRQARPRGRQAKTVFKEGWNDVKTGQLPPQPEFADGWNKWLTGKVPESSPGGEPASSSGTVPSAVGAKDQQLSGKAVKTSKSQATPYGGGGIGKGKGVKKPNELVLHMVPPQPETPAGMAPPPGGPPPPSSGKGRIKKPEAPLVKTRFTEANQAKSRASILTNLKAQRDKRAKSAPKLDPTPVPEVVAPKPTGKGRASKPTGKGRPPKGAIIGKQPVPEIVAPAAVRGRSKSATRTPEAASSSSGATAETTKRLRSKSKPSTPPIEVIVAPRPTRGRSIDAGPASRRIGSESRPPPIDPFAGPAQRLRSRTPAPKKTAAKEAPSSSSVAAEETGESTGKARKMEVGASAGKKPLKIPSKIKTSQIAEELKDLVKNKGWNQKDADRLQVLQKRVEDDPSTARDSSIEMQVIYKRNFNNLKKAH